MRKGGGKHTHNIPERSQILVFWNRLEIIPTVHWLFYHYFSQNALFSALARFSFVRFHARSFSFCSRSLFVRSLSRSFGLVTLILWSLAFRSFVFTLLRSFCARFSSWRSPFARTPTSFLCPRSCAFRCTFICLSVCFFSAITPRPCLWPLRAAQLPPALSVPPLLCI